MRRLLASLSALALAAGCSNTNSTTEKHECEPEVIDLSGCDKSTLSSLQTEGIWNTNLTFSDGTDSPSVIRFSGNGTPLLAGLPLTEKRDNFVLISDVQNSLAQDVRYLFAGCTATSPTQLSGRFRRCTDGAMDLEGSFDAARVTRRTGEADASRVELVSETSLPVDTTTNLPRGIASDVFVADGYAYVVALSGGLYIYDVHDPAHPQKKAELAPSSGDWNQVWVKGNTAYIASSIRGILLYDVTDRTAPKYISALPDKAVNANSVYVDGNRLYAASPSPNAEVLAYDISTPTAPTLLSRYFVEDSNPNNGDRPMEVVAQGNTMYVSHWTYGLAVVDVTNPKSFTLAGSFKYTGATSRAVAVGTVGSRTLAFETSEDWGGHVRALDVSVPAGIAQVGEYTQRAQVSARSMTLAGSKLYLADYQDGLRILDVSNPGEPQQVGYYNTWREADVGRGASFYEGLSGVRVPGDGYIYATDTSRGLLIFRETN